MPALPKRYYYMFWLVEPFLTILGAGYAIFLPEKYASSLLPETVERSTIGIGATTRGQMVIGALGSCFFLIAMISFSLFPVIQSLPESPTKVSLVKALLIPLAIADLSHIIVTLLPLPISLFKSPTSWTGLIHGNVTITIILFLVR
ncbi:hypothetical protein TREMEDRAFT_32751 [Tremella mesenterica DSM 1558]|uniref:uncharacterized protein n=1 Tax=Tremella mesenterica (strain ATCC 24925 / CBS 8224 / DSM 1558 / NBRC 9311 / NRRL Y-6157 / RJB 2259-6 / UBC 559-6) TaxID=578456 RepID=UPI0003F4935E|nr:uncharacterized protein TREMEDRAFT_32751 [Tremella mesenterica DSM 1558]EIW67851.1 hypothetical protein TREMEDRAFT_32751 [Tremella mesenterica DSM 1558]